MNEQHGIQAMCNRNHQEEGRFGRLFPELSALYTPPPELSKLGALGGPMDGANDDNNKPIAATIPMGFVFLGQFIDHDITLDTTSQLDRVNDASATQNFRTPALDLDCVYGAGPEANAFLYRDGLYLLTGKDGTGAPGQVTAHSDDDLVRNADGTAIIGDPRNDENRIISQMQLAFIRFHNSVVDHIVDEQNVGPTKLQNDPDLRKEIFEEARQLTTWHYQWVVLHEFLPIMVGQSTVSRILSEGRKFYHPTRPFIPIEFSAAAYRFGHSLAPERLKTKNGGSKFRLFSDALGKGFSPVDRTDQIIDWNLFFEFSDQSLDSVEFTAKLDGFMASGLLNLPFIRKGEKSLATRNLQRGQNFLLPSGEQVAAAMGIAQSQIDAVKDGFKDRVRDNNVDLSNGTPLWYYILMEAEVIGRVGSGTSEPGEGLGPVGGTIIAETLIGLLESDPTSFMGSNRNWTPSLGATPNQFTMADLVQFAKVLHA